MASPLGDSGPLSWRQDKQHLPEISVVTKEFGREKSCIIFILKSDGYIME